MDEVDIMVEECLSGMDESKRQLTEPVLMHYVWLVQQTTNLRRQIDTEGVMIEMEKGGANNRHTVMAENPAVATLHKLSSDLGNSYAKLMRWLSKAEVEQVDALQEFLVTR